MSMSAQAPGCDKEKQGTSRALVVGSPLRGMVCVMVLMGYNPVALNRAACLLDKQPALILRHKGVNLFQDNAINQFQDEASFQITSQRSIPSTLISTFLPH